MECHSRGRASDRQATGTGSISWCSKGFLPRVNFQCRLSFGVHTPLCAIACIDICAHVKDTTFHVRVQWIVATQTSPACTIATKWTTWSLWSFNRKKHKIQKVLCKKTITWLLHYGCTLCLGCRYCWQASPSTFWGRCVRIEPRPKEETWPWTWTWHVVSPSTFVTIYGQAHFRYIYRYQIYFTKVGTCGLDRDDSFWQSQFMYKYVGVVLFICFKFLVHVLYKLFVQWPCGIHMRQTCLKNFQWMPTAYFFCICKKLCEEITDIPSQLCQGVSTVYVSKLFHTPEQVCSTVLHVCDSLSSCLEHPCATMHVRGWPSEQSMSVPYVSRLFLLQFRACLFHYHTCVWLFVLLPRTYLSHHICVWLSNKTACLFHLCLVFFFPQLTACLLHLPTFVWHFVLLPRTYLCHHTCMSVMLLGCRIAEILLNIFISYINGRLARPPVHRKWEQAFFFFFFFGCYIARRYLCVLSWLVSCS